jgi:poly-gamma-glutamate synthesis protein (capsule biosynthesis protein)
VPAAIDTANATSDPVSAAPTPDPAPATASSGPVVAPGTDDPAAPPEPTPPPATPSSALVDAEVAVVPVTSFRSPRLATRPAEVRTIEQGGDGPWDSLVLVEDDADAILAALDTDRSALGKRLVTVESPAALRRNLARHPARLGFLRADDVDASVRALAWGSRSLFGVDRVGSLDAWPLTVSLPVPEGSAPDYDPAAAWTLAAGGDILLDRGVSKAIDGHRRGASFPFDGGTVDITGLCRDCSPFGWDTPYTRRTGNAGIVRDLLRGADLAIANFENPAPDDWRFHPRGMVFSANPADIEGLQRAGIDWVSLANNHIGDAGRDGIVDTMRHLDRHGIAYSGAGKNQARAHRAALLVAGDTTVAILGYDTIAARYAATADAPGSARMTEKALKRDIRNAREAGADVVIVFPHWGVEYTARTTEGQRRLGRAAIDAGADLVIGNHPHWVGAMEVYDGRPIWYALGNLVFDQDWSIPTSQGILLELTFDGDELVQAVMRPHLILERSQPNLLDPLGDGRAVLRQLFKASSDLPW